ncbi:hypothetical protein COB52_05205 [Candidatus Kaiserbacteria bacterium]|nr:MAG: hypothetical protein COB52_05205 [Candidatus Kaiserbacteria bacterium]
MPFTGADIGGFHGNFDDAENEVGEDKGQMFLARFHQVGAFFPFARNHNIIGHPEGEEFIDSTDQAPYMITNVDYRAGVQAAFKTRYSLLRHYYTQLFLAQRDGTPFFLPAYFFNPEDEKTTDDYESTVMIGRELMVVLPLTEAEEITVYLPSANNWYHLNLATPHVIVGGNDAIFEDTWTDVNILLRSGSVIVTQHIPEGLETTKDLLELPVEMLIFPDSNGQAHGKTYIADGELLVENHQLWNIAYDVRTITFSDELSDSTAPQDINGNEIISKITVVDSE